MHWRRPIEWRSGRSPLELALIKGSFLFDPFPFFWEQAPKGRKIRKKKEDEANSTKHIFFFYTKFVRPGISWCASILLAFAVWYISIMLPSQTRHLMCQSKTAVLPSPLPLSSLSVACCFKWFELGSNLLSIDRREQTAIDCFAYLFYYGRLGDIRGRPSSLSGYDLIHSLNLGDNH